MVRPKLEVADIIRRYGAAFRAQHDASLSVPARRVLGALERCRTAALGGHLEQCDQCQHQRNAYNSCRSRFCPKCQSLARALWLEHRQAELLECRYFHVVFTLPQPIAAIAYQNKALLYNLLFSNTAETLHAIAADPKHLGAEIGFLTVLHTWGQTLTHHPHVHCLVPGGGLAPDGEQWLACRPRFFLPVKVLSRFFRRRFLEQLERLFDRGELRFFSALEPLRERQAFLRYLAPLREQDWVVYAKPPFAGARHMLGYLGRYTHRIAFSNHRLRKIDDDHVQFKWRDYRDHNRSKLMTLSADEFLRRFLLHVLPPGFQRLRYYGFMANRHRREKLARCRMLLGMTSAPTASTVPPSIPGYRERHEALTGRSLIQCPACRTGQMRTVAHFRPSVRAPPRFAAP